MKVLFGVLLIAISSNAFAQVKPPGRVNQNKTTSSKRAVTIQQSNGPIDTAELLKPRQTATDRYLNGPERKGTSTVTGSTPSTSSSPFAGGVHPADNAAKSFDTLAGNKNNANNQTANNQGAINQTAINQGANNQTANTTVRGGNDTTFNVNTVVSQGGVTTNSGAVDRSGQAQFGQTNWGTSRSTVGESQWTIPPPITASFNKEFPASNNTTWTRNNVDTTIYSAKYKSGTQWVTTNYNATGQRLDMRTEFPLIQPPAPVSVYMAKQPAGFRAATIYKLQIQGRPDLYEIETASGKKIYINNDGMEVNY